MGIAGGKGFGYLFARGRKLGKVPAERLVDELLDERGVEVLVSRDGLLSGAYAVAGYPALTVPAGIAADGTPRGLTFQGGYLEDGEVIGYAFAFEQATMLRVLPPGVAGE